MRHRKKLSKAKAGQERKKEKNRETKSVTIDGLTFSKNCVSVAQDQVVKIAKAIKRALAKRFEEFEDNSIYQNMKFFDSKFWDKEDEKYGEQIKFFYDHFAEPLDHQCFELPKAFSEWRAFKFCVRENYHRFSAKALWRMVLTKRSEEYPNLSLLGKLLFAISGSNSTVERAFSTLTQIITDRRVHLKHDVIENIMLIKGNDCNWSSKERDDLISRAREFYCSKQRQRNREPAAKKKKVDGSTPVDAVGEVIEIDAQTIQNTVNRNSESSESERESESDYQETSDDETSGFESLSDSDLSDH